jgi:hypothetical protein
LLGSQLSGWALALADANLPMTVRQDIVRNYDEAEQEQSRLEGELEAAAALGRHLQGVLDPAKVLESLKRLDDVLGKDNATLANLELARHIERIDCYADGRVVLRGTYLGLFEGAVELLSGSSDGAVEDGAAEALYGQVRPRRLTRRRVQDLTSTKPMAGGVDHQDPHRFAGLADAFLWEDTLVLPVSTFWSKENGAEVAALWATDPKAWRLPRLAKHFGVSIPTARKALRIGQAAAGMEIVSRKLAPRGIDDARAIADPVAGLYFQSGSPLTIREIADRLGVNQVTASKALDHWYAERGLERPDGRATRSQRVVPGAVSADGSPPPRGETPMHLAPAPADKVAG